MWGVFVARPTFAEISISRMRCLWISNSPRLKTGYGVETALFVPRLQRAGYEMAIFAFAGQEGAPSVDTHGITHFPRLFDAWGNDVVQAHADFFGADFVFGLYDPHVTKPEVAAGLNWAHWVPVDCEPLLPANERVMYYMRWILSFSRFGQRVIEDAGFKSMYVPLAVDCTVYRPVDRSEARQRLSKTWHVETTDKFIVAMNAANKGMPSRKGFYQAFKAFKILIESVKSIECLLYVHSESTGVNGENLYELAQLCGIPLNNIVFVEQYPYLTGMVSEKYLNDVYNAADVFLHTAHGEGFGIPIVEAQAAGCPAIVTDFSSMPELCFGGWKVAGTRYTYYTGVEWMLPDYEAVSEALIEAVNDAQRRRAAATLGAQQYHVDHVMERYMLPAFRTIEQDLLAERRRRQPRGIVRETSEYDITVVVPCFGKAKTLERAIMSALQDDAKVEVIVVNSNPADDESHEILKKLTAQYPRLCVINRADEGVAADLNAGAEAARGRYIIPLEADDWLEAGCLRQIVSCLDAHPEAGFAFGCVQYHGRLDQLVCPPDDFVAERIFEENVYLYPVVFRRELFGKVKWHQFKAAKAGINDWDFNIQLTRVAQGLPLPDVLVLHYEYQHGTADEAQRKPETAAALLAELKARHSEVQVGALP